MLHHHATELIVILFALLFAAAVFRLVIGNPNGARHRVRVLRWRIRFYLRPGPGYANMIELAVRWSRLRAVGNGRRARPALPWWARMILPVTAYGVRLGRAHFGRRVIASMEDQTLVLAAPRTGKSGWLADRIIDHPGAAMTTTTRTDLFENTVPLRGQFGIVHIFNPEGIGGLPSTFRWNPLQGCEQPSIALLRATSFTAATASKDLHDMIFWIGKATSVLASFLHAAALDGRTMLDVYQWAHGTDDSAPEQILTAHPGAADGWLGPIREIRKPGRTADSIRMTVTRALAWLADPAVAAATSPGPDEGFDVTDFVSGRNTLYMIGSGREDAPIAPLFRAFAEYVHFQAAYVGSLQPHGRLDPPMLMALDEVTQICPVPLPQWMADSAGKGILIVAVCHGLAQLEARWENSGARAIWDTAGIKVILGGVADPDTLDRLSRLCGEISLRTHSYTRDHEGKRARTVTYEPVQVLPPELLRTLPERRALIVRTNLSPVVVRLRMAWRRHDYRRARRRGLGPVAGQLAAAAASGTQVSELSPRELPSSPTAGPSMPGQAELPLVGLDEPDTRRPGNGSRPASSWPPPQDMGFPWPPSGQRDLPQVRRPWHRPVDPGESR
jgi:type IV secretory pathway TraG/TraD family ATPase VirD4